MVQTRDRPRPAQTGPDRHAGQLRRVSANVISTGRMPRFVASPAVYFSAFLFFVSSRCIPK